MADRPDPPAPRSVVIVVAGVGDDAAGAASRRVVRGLAALPEFDRAEEVVEWYPVPDRYGVGRQDTQSVTRTRVWYRDGRCLDLFEFWWADLSRFPAAMRSYLVALFGLLLQVLSVGRAAMRGGEAVHAGPQVRGDEVPRPRRNGDVLLGLVDWLVAVPVLIVIGALVALVGALALALATASVARGWQIAALAGYAVVVALVAFAATQPYTRHGRLYVRELAAAAALLALAGCIVLSAWHGASRGIADALLLGVAYPFRLLWLAVALVVLVALVPLGRLGRTPGPDRRSAATALLGLATGPLGFAILSGAIFTALGKIAERLGSRVGWAGPPPECLKNPADWTPSVAECGAGAGRNALDWGNNLLERAATPLLYFGIIAAVLLVVTLIRNRGEVAEAFHRRLSNPTDADATRQGNRLTRALGHSDDGPACGILIAALALAVLSLFYAWVDIPGASRPDRAASLFAAGLGLITAFLAFVASVFKISPVGLVTAGQGGEKPRLILDKAYDVATYLREPTPQPRRALPYWLRPPDRQVMPRQRIMARYAALMDYVTGPGPAPKYERVVFFAHSQGTVLTATLLAEPAAVVRLPRDVVFISFGCPLRQTYARRIPAQFGWVERLPDPECRREYIGRLNERWLSFAAAGDPVGRTVFAEPPADGWAPRTLESLDDGRPLLTDEITGYGGHSSYWSSPRVLAELRGSALC
jgi:hypothetical protein